MNSPDFVMRVSVRTVDGVTAVHTYGLSKDLKMADEQIRDITSAVAQSIIQPMSMMKLDSPIVFYSTNKVVSVAFHIDGPEELVERTVGFLDS